MKIPMGREYLIKGFMGKNEENPSIWNIEAKSCICGADNNLQIITDTGSSRVDPDYYSKAEFPVEKISCLDVQCLGCNRIVFNSHLMTERKAWKDIIDKWNSGLDERREDAK